MTAQLLESLTWDGSAAPTMATMDLLHHGGLESMKARKELTAISSCPKGLRRSLGMCIVQADTRHCCTNNSLARQEGGLAHLAGGAQLLVGAPVVGGLGLAAEHLLLARRAQVLHLLAQAPQHAVVLRARGGRAHSILAGCLNALRYLVDAKSAPSDPVRPSAGPVRQPSSDTQHIHTLPAGTKEPAEILLKERGGAIHDENMQHERVAMKGCLHACCIHA